MQRKWGAAAIALAAIGALAAISWTVSFRYHVHMFQQNVDQSTAIITSTLQNRTGGYSSLAVLLSEDPQIARALRTEPDHEVISSLNRALKRAIFNSGAEQAYVIDTDGKALASSKWVGLETYPDLDLSFRPYFTEAMQNGSGTFHALGLNKPEPSSFVAARVDAWTGPVGAVVVQFAPFSTDPANWGSDTAIGLANESGIVFMTNREDWFFRPLRELTPQMLERIAATHQFDGIDIEGRTPLLAGNDQGQYVPESWSGMVARIEPIEDLGLTLVVAKSLTGASFAAIAVTSMVTLFGLIVSGLVLIFLQHRQIVRIQRQQSTLLEEKVEERTRELEAEIEVRRRTEANLRDAEHELVQAAKLAALGQMSAALAHEVSQPLTALAATLAAAERRLDNGETGHAADLIGRAQNLILRLQHTIRHLKSFSKKERGEAERIALAKSIESALELAETRTLEIGASVEVGNLDAGIEVMGNPVRLEQVFINLVLNALDAVAGAGTRVIGVDLSEVAGVAVVSVWDTGAGIPDMLLERLSEPFFTTKSDGEGIGLGLSISQSILADYDGSLKFSARPGGGTICEVRLPCASTDASVEAAE